VSSNLTLSAKNQEKPDFKGLFSDSLKNCAMDIVSNPVYKIAGGRHFVEYYILINGEKVRKREYGNIGRLKTPEEREALANKIIDQILGKVPGRELTLANALELALQLKGGLRPKSIITYRTTVNHLTKFAGEDILIKDFTTKQATYFMDHLLLHDGKSGRTCNNIRGHLRLLFNVLIDREYIQDNPFKKIKKLPQETKRYMPYTMKQVNHVLDHLDRNRPNFAMLIRMVLYCYVRTNELCNIKIEHIDLERRTLTIPAYSAKNRRLEIINIPTAYWNRLEQFIKGAKYSDYLFSTGFEPGKKQLRPRQLQYAHRDVMKEVGFSKEYLLYAWKHTGAIIAIDAGVNIKELQLQLRHKDLSTTDNYLRSIGAVIKPAIVDKMPDF